MIGTLNVAVNAANPNIPLKTLFAYIHSPSSIRVIDVPKKIGKWSITEVFITANYPDNRIITSQCVLTGGCWTATIVGSTVTGKSLNGFTISANGQDENGNPITGYVLGKGAIEILDADTKLAPTDPIYYIHVLTTKPDNPTKGDAYVDGGVWYFYNGESWVTLGGTYAGNGWVQYPESEGGDGKWHRLVISDGKIAYEEDGVDEPESDPFALKSDLDAEVDRSTQADEALQGNIDSLSTSVNTRITEEISRATGVEGIISGDLGDEIERAVGKENEISSKLDDTISAYQAKDTELQNSIEDEVQRATEAEQINSQAISDEETARISSDEELEGKIYTETIRAKAAEGVLSSRLDADEILINTNAQGIAAEVQRANGVESFLSGKIDDINSELEGVATKSELSDETEARKAADSDLQSQITTISSDYLKSTDKTEIEGKITAEETRSKDVENALSAAINTKADTNDVVKLTDNQTITGDKTFSGIVKSTGSSVKGSAFAEAGMPSESFVDIVVPETGGYVTLPSKSGWLSVFGSFTGDGVVSVSRTLGTHNNFGAIQRGKSGESFRLVIPVGIWGNMNFSFIYSNASFSRVRLYSSIAEVEQ